MFEYLPFEQSELPIRKTFEVSGQDFEFELSYTEETNVYKMILRDLQGELLYIAPLRYFSAWNSIPIVGFPNNVKLVPIDLDDFNSLELNNEINPSNFGSKVKIYLMEESNVS
jgi:hypothetical protein